MRILQVVPFFPPAHGFGGLAEITYQISKALVRRGHETVVYTSDARDLNSRLDVHPVEYLDGIEVHYFENLPVRPIKNLFVTPGLVLKAKADVKNFDVVHLHGHWSFQNIVLHHYVKKFSIPYVFQAHGCLPRDFSLQRMKRVYDLLFGTKILNDASKVIAVTRMEAQQYYSRGVPKHKVALVPNGVNLSQLIATKGAFRTRFSISSHWRIILFLGRLHPLKGIDLLIEAYARLVEEFDDIMLVVVGPDEGHLSNLRQQVRSLGLTRNVLFTGLLCGNEKLQAYIDSEVFVLPSRYEIFGLVILEAYAFSVPVVASNLPSISQIVQDGQTGYLFKPGHVQSLVDGIARVLRNREDAKKMGANGRRLVEDRYTIDRVVESIEAIYDDLLSSKSVL